MRRRLISAYIVFGASSAVAVATPPTALASPGWLSPVSVAEGTSSATGAANVVMDAKGDALLVWIQYSGKSNAIYAAWRPAGGSFGAPVTLSRPSASISSPAVAMDPRGDATVVWLSGSPESQALPTAVEAARRPAGGVFSRLAGPLSEGDARTPVVAMDATGDTTVAWAAFNGGASIIDTTSRPVGGEFTAPAALSEFLGVALTPAVAMDPHGDTTIAWTLNHSLGPIEELFPIQVITRAAKSNFGALKGMPLEQVYHPTVAMNSSGETVVAWVTYSKERAYIQTWRRRTISEEFEMYDYIPGSFLGEAAPEILPQLSMDEAGDAVIAWEYAGVNFAMQAPGGEFNQPTELQGSNPSTGPLSLTMNNHGDGVMAWAGTSDSGSYAAGSTKSAGGTFSPPVTLSDFSNLLPPENEKPPVNVAMDANGDATAAWISSDGTHNTVEVAGYQSGGPQLEALQIPSAGQADTPLTFSVSLLGVWSPPTSTSWSWDDGSPGASGTDVTHVFHVPGTYTVTVSASNALNKVTIATRTVTIQAAPSAGSEVINGGRATDKPIVASGSTLPSRKREATPRPVAPAFTPLFATRAAIDGRTLGLLVEIAAIRGAASGDTIVVRCIAGCTHALHETARLQRHHSLHGKIIIAPPLALRQSTRIEIDLQAPHHITRFIQYRFVRTHLGVIAHITHQGCLAPAKQPTACL